MKRTFLVLAAVAALGTSQSAQAGSNGGAVAAGVIGGLAAGAILGGAAAAQPRYYEPRYYYKPRYYAPPPAYVVEPAYGSSCYYTRGRPVWDDYRGVWVRPRVRVCD